METEAQQTQFYNKMTEISLMKRIGTAEDIANLTSFLLSDDAANITGSIFLSDSGGLLKPTPLPELTKK